MGTGSRTATRIVVVQLIVTAAAVVLILGFGNWRAAWSAGVGGLISALSTAWFALRVFGRSTDASVKQVVRGFYAGETQKLLLTALMFYVVIRWMDVSFLPLFLTYAVTLLVYWAILPFSLESR